MEKYQATSEQELQVENMDVYSEEFQLLFHATLEKFVNEYDDMAYMDVIAKARELLEAINDN